jgi:hypothetical protein
MAWTEFDYAQYRRRSGQAANDDTPEQVLLGDIRRVARAHGWLVYHTHDSRRSDEGFPDLVLVREAVLMYELKTNTGKLTPAQQTWLTLLERTGQVECGVWRPRDLAAIEARLTRPWRAA